MRRIAIAIAALAAVLGAVALAVEAHDSVARSLADGRGVLDATFLYLRFFTILTNIGLVALQASTAWRLARGRVLPAGRLYDAALVYAIVTGATYELLLRGLWLPQDWMFASDNVLHDATPVLMAATWALTRAFTRSPASALSPAHRATGWTGPLALLAFPAGYLAVTLVAGAYGKGYPYDFLNVAKIGFGNVLLVSLAFLFVFLALGWGIGAAARRWLVRNA